MNNLTAQNNSPCLSKQQLQYFMFFSTCWIVFCFILIVPPARNCVLEFLGVVKATLLNRPAPFDFLKWHNRLSQFGIYGIVMYGIYCFLLFRNPAIKDNQAVKIQFALSIFAGMFFVFIIMFKANWIFSDDHEYIVTTAVNKYIPSNSGGGRFLPFRYIHFNLPLFIFRCLGIHTGLPVEAHFAVIAVLFAVSFLCLCKLFNTINPANAYNPLLSILFFVCMFFLVSYDFLFVFMDIIFPETLVIMLFSLFMLMYRKALETDQKRYYIFAFLAAVYGTYSKEPVFGVFLIIVFFNHLFRYKNESKREKLFYILLAMNGILYITLYYFLSYRNAAGFYNEGRVVAGRIQLLISIFRGSPILLIMTCFGCTRLWWILFKKDKTRLYYDSLLFAGMGYTFAYVLLRLNAAYYFTPAIILFLPSFVYWTRYFLAKKHAAAVFLLCILLLVSVYRTTWIAESVKNSWREREQFMPYIEELLAEYHAGKDFIWYESDNGVTENTFYRAVRNWRKHVENMFLNYADNSEQNEFFTVWKSQNTVVLEQNILFFYPVDNDQYQPMPNDLDVLLKSNNFEIYKDTYGVLIFKRP